MVRPTMNVSCPTAFLLFAFTPLIALAQPVSAPERKVLDGITTRRIVPGMPYELAGKRIVFTNWYYIQPGDLDWRNSEGKSVYVQGNEGPFAARHIGINAPHGIRIAAEKPQILGPIDRPHRMILHDGDSTRAGPTRTITNPATPSTGRRKRP